MRSAYRLASGTVILLAATILLTACGGEEPAPAGEQVSGAGVVPETVRKDLPPEALAALNEVVAVANGVEIIAGDVLKNAEARRQQMLAQGQTLSAEQEQQLLVAALDTLISGELMLQDARERGLSVDPALLESQFQESRDRLGTQEAFQAYLVERGLTEQQVREALEETLLMQQYVSSVTGKAVVEDSVVRRYYDEHPEEFMEGEQMKASWILIRCTPEDSQEKRDRARERIELVQSRLEEGVSFEELAKEYSQTSSAAKGGDIGYFPRGVMMKPFEEAAFKLKPGEISPIFETETGYNILKATGYKDATAIPFEEIKPSLTLRLTKTEGEKFLSARMQELIRSAKVEIPPSRLFSGVAPEPKTD